MISSSSTTGSASSSSSNKKICSVCEKGEDSPETLFNRKFSVKDKNLAIYRECFSSQSVQCGPVCDNCYQQYYNYRRYTPSFNIEDFNIDSEPKKRGRKKGWNLNQSPSPSSASPSSSSSVSTNNNNGSVHTGSIASSSRVSNSSSNRVKPSPSPQPQQHASSSQQQPVGMCGKGVDKVKLDFNFDETITESIDKAKSVKQWLELGCSNFEQVESIDFSEATDDIVDLYLYKLGKPIVLTNAHQALAEGSLMMENSNHSGVGGVTSGASLNEHLKKQQSLFHLNYLRDVCGGYETTPRDNMTFMDENMLLKEYIDFVQGDRNIRALNRRILYGKDIRCPDEWANYLFKNNPRFPERFKYKGSKDILANTPAKAQSINLMIYVGNSETFTPAHKDVCGALGHNIMVYADNERTHAIWCILKYQDLDAIRKFWQQNGAFLDDDNCFLPLHILSKAPFTVQLYEQKLGDLVLLPPSSPHQVLNMGGKSIKVAWNTLSCLALPYSYEILDEYRKFGKSQVYRIKAVTYYSMIKYTKQSEEYFNSISTTRETTTSTDSILLIQKDPKRFFNDFLILLRVFDDILFEESINSEQNSGDDGGDEDLIDINIKKLPESPNSMHLRYCNHCKGDIFNRCYHAREFEDGYDLCMDCVAEGRGFLYKDSLELMEHLSYRELKEKFEQAKMEFLRFSLHYNDKIVKTATTKTTTIVVRDMNDVNELIAASRDVNNTVSISTIAFNNLQMLKRHSNTTSTTNKKNTNKNAKNTTDNKKDSDDDNLLLYCHQCQTHKFDYLFSRCSKCPLNYCNQCLWDRYALTLCECKRRSNWLCPKCSQCGDVCNCMQCLKERNVECLDYSSNILSRLDDIKEILPFSVGDVNGSGSSGSGSSGGSGSSVSDFQPKPIKRIIEAKHAQYLMNITNELLPSTSSSVGSSSVGSCLQFESTILKKSSNGNDELSSQQQQLKKRKLIIVNKNPKRTKLKIIHNRQQDVQIGVCFTCKRSISTQIVHQSKLEKFKFYCDFCVNKDHALSSSKKNQQLIVFDYLCDQCRMTIIGVRFHHGPTGCDLCQRCYISNSFPQPIQEYELSNNSSDGSGSGGSVSKSFEIKIPDYADLKQ